MAYLITGGTGFIGAYIVRDLLEAGQRVVCYDIAPNPALVEEVAGAHSTEELTILRGDVTDAIQLQHAIREHGVDRVVHLASLLTSSSDANFPLAMRVNCHGTNNVFEAATLFGLEKVVWASSIAVFGPRSTGKGGLIANDAPHDPQTVYGACKAFNESMAKHYTRKYDLDLIGLRYTLVYGYGKMETVVRGSGVTHLTEIIDKPALDQGPSVVPRGDDDGDWLYVEDVARAVVAADSIVRPKTKAFNIVGDMRSTREVSDYVSALLPDADIRLESGGSGRSWNYDGSAARDEIGYVPQFKIEEGIKRNINDLRGRAGLPLVGQESF